MTIPLPTTNRHLLKELQAIRIGLEILIERTTGAPISLIALARSDEVVGLTDDQQPLNESAITYERPQSIIDSETYEEEETDAEFVAAAGGFKQWRPTAKID